MMQYSLALPLSCHVVCTNPVFKSGSLKAVLFMHCKPVRSRKQLWQNQRDREEERGGGNCLSSAQKEATLTAAETKGGELWDLGVRAALCLQSVRSLCLLAFFLSSTVPAGEGPSAVPGLLTCPSIPQELKQGHCCHNGDCEFRTRQADKGTVAYNQQSQTVPFVMKRLLLWLLR